MMMSRLPLAVAWRPSRPFLRRATRVVITGAAALALAACSALPSPAGARSGTAVTSASAPRSGARAAVAPPRFFADIAAGPLGGRGVLQVRDSATGRLVAQDQRVLATGLAALADGRTFVVAEPAGNSCATRLYRLRLNDRGEPGRPSRLQVPELHGEVWSLAASGNGSVLGYAVSGCSKGDRGYIGVVRVPSGRATRWGEVNLGGVSRGNVALNGAVSLSANGRMLAFPAFGLSASSRITEQAVRVLHTDAPPGTVAHRSRVAWARPYPPYRPLLVAATLSPGGGTLYTCTTFGQAGHAVRLSAYRTTTGRLRRTLATLTVTGSPLAGSGYCPIALDGAGEHMLVPYTIRNSRTPGAGAELSIAEVAISAGRIAVLKVRLPGIGGMEPATGMSIAW
jgi:hypothetical protein